MLPLRRSNRSKELAGQPATPGVGRVVPNGIYFDWAADSSLTAPS
jgi:hypothetical protein